MSDEVHYLSHWDDRTLGEFVVDGPRSLMLEPERDVWWAADFFVRRFVPNSLFESLVYFRRFNYSEEMPEPPYIARYCLWTPAIIKQQKVSCQKFRLQTEVKYGGQTLDQAAALKSHLQHVATSLVTQPKGQPRVDKDDHRSVGFIRFEVHLYGWTAVRLDFREDASSLDQEHWKPVAQAFANAKLQAAHSLSVEVCERFATDRFDSIVDIAPSDLSSVHELV